MQRGERRSLFCWKEQRNLSCGYFGQTEHEEAAIDGGVDKG
jgi:hypothetical protein